MVGIGESFKPHPDAKKLFFVYLLIPALLLAVLIFTASAVVYYLALPEAWIVASALVIPYLVAIVFVAYWIPRYLSTVTYTMAEDRVIFEGGLWWRRKSLVPYNRITNVDILQGPLSRRFGMGKVSIQTAGYSGQGTSGMRFAEISMFGVKDLEGVKDAIMNMTSRVRPLAVEAGVESHPGTLNAEILQELRMIRKGIENQSGKT